MNRTVTNTATSVLASLLLPALTPQLHGQGDKLEINIRSGIVVGNPGDSVILAVAPTDGPPLRFPGISGSLVLNPAHMFVLGSGVRATPGVSQFKMIRPRGLHANFHGQALVASPLALRISEPFRILDEDPIVRNPNPGNRNLPGLPLGSNDPEPEEAPVAIMRMGHDVRFDVWLVPPGNGPDEDSVAGRRTGNDQNGPPESSPEMSGLTELSNSVSKAFPYRMNCKLEMSFPSGNYMGSGVMIDPYHVMTAGHCVYDRDVGGYASKITVTPGFDDDRADQAPFGSATWTRGDNTLIWANWVVSRRSSHDIAIIKLDRPIGAITSWFGYGYRTNCSFYKSTRFYSGSYPGETPYTGGDMHWRAGSFDFCPTQREARFWLRGFRGESGSGYYYINGGHRYVHGVLSHRTKTLWHKNVTDMVRLTHSKFVALGDFLKLCRPMASDLIPVYTRTSKERVGRGKSVGVTVRVLNYGRIANLSPSCNIYASRDRNISGADTLLGNARKAGLLTSINATDIAATVNLPASLATGTWYIGAVITSRDANNANNTTGVQDVARIVVE